MKGYIDSTDWFNIEPMKYWSFTSSTPVEQRKTIVKNAIFSNEYIGSLKIDGYYQRILKDSEGNCFMIARSRNVNGEVINKIDWVPQLREWLNIIPNSSCFLCECYLPNNEGSNKITSILGCLKEKAITRQKETPLNFYIFDVMAFNGENLKDTKFIDRIKYLDILRINYPNQYVTYATYYEGQELWYKIQEYLNSGREGVVIMRKDAKVYNKRTPARVSIKIKKELKENIDVVIIGANEPTIEYNGKDIETWKYWENLRTGEKLSGEYFKSYNDGASIHPVTKAYFNGWAGSLIIGAKKDNKIVKIGSLSGLTEEVLSNWKDYIGKVAEITGMQILVNGIRHPKFVKWREDLTKNDTNWYRIFGDT